MNNQELEEPKLKASTVKLLRPYFDRNCTIDYTSSQTAAARGTVRKYFQVWTKLLIEELDTDFIKMQKEAKARGIGALQVRINDVSVIVQELIMLNEAHMKREQALWKKDKTHEVDVNKWLTDKIARLSKDIFMMEQIKVMIQMKPTADITLQLQIDEMLSKVKPEDLKHMLEESKEKTND